MAAYALVFGIVVVAIALAFGQPLVVEWRRKRLRERLFPKPWKRILEKRLPLYYRLPDELKIQLHGHIQVFLAEKTFHGCGGLEITDEIKITIAAEACVLILNRKTDYYPGLNSILVYPAEFIVRGVHHDGAGVYTDEEQILSGESWGEGKVVLSWDDARRRSSSVSFGENVVLHEFAHQLDQQDGRANGVPILDRRADYPRWTRVFTNGFEGLRAQVDRGEGSCINEYGAESPAEFFATATEAFFEKSEQLKQEHGELYEELRNYYKVDPAEWH
ncbi:MAG: zinc-dependent peptidase [Gammaproteobacteria bacterium]|nr:zinc-dependent peptidase [Gammaproteobacteria bacterium]